MWLLEACLISWWPLGDRRDEFALYMDGKGPLRNIVRGQQMMAKAHLCLNTS